MEIVCTRFCFTFIDKEKFLIVSIAVCDTNYLSLGTIVAKTFHKSLMTEELKELIRIRSGNFWIKGVNSHTRARIHSQNSKFKIRRQNFAPQLIFAFGFLHHA